MADSPYDLVRVSTPSAHVTVTRAAAELAGLTPLKADAVDRYGKPLPAKPRTTKAGESKTAAATSEKKENG